MGGDLQAMIHTASTWVLPVLFAITLHEAAHGYVARHFGDPTAWRLGRISLNPLRHIDPVGTVVLPAITYLVSGFMFGWAKPVPVDFGKLRNPKRNMLWVALAGPGANFFMVLVWAALLKLTLGMPAFGYSLALSEMARAGIKINAMFMALNLMPIPPLDGGRIVVSLLPYRAAWQFSRIEPYGMWILIALLFTRMLDVLLLPLLSLVYSLIMALFRF